MKFSGAYYALQPSVLSVIVILILGIGVLQELVSCSFVLQDFRTAQSFYRDIVA
jgi:hypothetical protein